MPVKGCCGVPGSRRASAASRLSPRGASPPLAPDLARRPYGDLGPGARYVCGPRPFSAVCALWLCAPCGMAAPCGRAFCPPSGASGRRPCRPSALRRRRPLRHPPACRKSPCGGTGTASGVLPGLGPRWPRPLRSAHSSFACASLRLPGPRGPRSRFSQIST